MLRLGSKTSQLFEYLLALKNMNSNVSYDLEQYTSHWFLDDLLTSGSFYIVDGRVGQGSYMELRGKDLVVESPQVSDPLLDVFRLLQFDSSVDDNLIITTDQLEAIIASEFDSLRKKVGGSGSDVVVINDWQRLIMGVNSAQISSSMVLDRINNSEAFSRVLLDDYALWQERRRNFKNELKRRIRAREVYDYFINLIDSVNGKSSSVLFGVGLLHVPGKNRVYHPLLTIEFDVSFDVENDVLRFVPNPMGLRLEFEILTNVLLYETQEIMSLREEVERMSINPFNDAFISGILQRFIKYLHPGGRYILPSSDVDVNFSEYPAVAHKSVLIFKDKIDDDLSTELKNVISYTKSGGEVSHVVNKIIDSNYVNFNYDFKSGWGEIADSTLFALPFYGGQKEIVSFLAEHDAVVVSGNDDTNRNNAIVNLISRLMASGKNVLVTGEDRKSLEMVSNKMPDFLKGLFAPMFGDVDSKFLLQEGIRPLFEGLTKHDPNFISNEVLSLTKELSIVDRNLSDVLESIVEFRSNSSKKVFWRDGFYKPYELAQIMARQSGKYNFIQDRISMDAVLDISEDDFRKGWELKSTFKPETLHSLKQKFPDVNEILSRKEYENLIIAETKYSEIALDSEGLEDVFDADNDLSLIYYLAENLPRIMGGLNKVADEYENALLQDALTDLGRYHVVELNFERLSQGVEELKQLVGDEDNFNYLATALNKDFNLNLEGLESIDGDVKYQNIVFSYEERLQLMRNVLEVANDIWVLNGEAISFSNGFRGISADGLDGIDILYAASIFARSKFEVANKWSNLRSNLLRDYEAVLVAPAMHPICKDLYDALSTGDLIKFKELMTELEMLSRLRQDFIMFGNLLDDIGSVMPIFAKSIVMGFGNSNSGSSPKFKDVFDYGKLKTFFDDMREYDIKNLEKEALRLTQKKKDLMRELIEKRSWQAQLVHANFKDNFYLYEYMRDLDRIDGTVDVSDVIRQCQPAIPVWMMETSAVNGILGTAPTLFDVVIVLDANVSSLLNLSVLMRAHKAVLFDGTGDSVQSPFEIPDSKLNEISKRYDNYLGHMGVYDVNSSLFDIVSNSAGVDSKVVLDNDIMSHLNNIGNDVQVDVKKCSNALEDDIFESLVKLNYAVKCKVVVNDFCIDFLIEGESNSLAVNVIGDVKVTELDAIEELRQEQLLQDLGVNMYNLNVIDFCLNPRDVLSDLSERLKILDILPRTK